MKAYLHVAWAIFRKDLRVELRTKDAFSAMVVFGILTVVIFNFAFDLAREEAIRLAPGALWVAYVFAGVLGLNRSFAMERENEAVRGLSLAPVDAGAVYLGKLLANCCFMLAFQLVVFPLFVIFFNLSILAHVPALLGIMVLGTLGFTAVGTILSAVAANTKMREVLLPILLLPMAFPAVIGAVEATALVMREMPGVGDWVRMLVVFDIVFIVLSSLTFEYVLGE